MSKWISDSHIDLILNEIKESNREVMCSNLPATFFNAVWPDLWIQDTAYVIGDLVHPPSFLGYIYECTADGTSGSTEPGWGNVQDQTFFDGTVSWKTHANYSLASQVLDPADIVLGDGDIDGRKITIAQKIGVVTHAAGTVTNAALIDTVEKVLHYVTDAETTIAGDNDVESGRTTIFFEFDIVIRDPQ